MTYILFSVICSVIVSVLLKLAPRWRVDMRQAIAGNYLIAALLCVFSLHGSPGLLFRAPTDAAWLLLISLGILLPGIFLVMAGSVQRVGMVRTDAAQRLSLLLPLIAAFTLFGEALTWQKTLGALVGLAAILCIVLKNGASHSGRINVGDWYWPAIVFVGMGLIDILFKYMAMLTGVPFPDVLLATFILAFALSALYLSRLYAQKRIGWRWRNVIAAIALGAFNFGNILFYIEAHRHLSRDPALVFSAMNIGVIVFATLVGAWLFRERLSRLNYAGLLLAVIAVVILTGA